HGLVPPHPADGRDLAVVPVAAILGPVGAVLVLLEIDDVGALAFGQVALAAGEARLFVVPLELAGPIHPDATNAEIDEQAETEKEQDAQQHGGTDRWSLEAEARPPGAILDGMGDVFYHRLGGKSQPGQCEERALGRDLPELDVLAIALAQGAVQVADAIDQAQLHAAHSGPPFAGEQHIVRRLEPAFTASFHMVDE